MKKLANANAAKEYIREKVDILQLIKERPEAPTIVELYRLVKLNLIPPIVSVSRRK